MPCSSSTWLRNKSPVWLFRTVFQYLWLRWTPNTWRSGHRITPGFRLSRTIQKSDIKRDSRNISFSTSMRLAFPETLVQFRGNENFCSFSCQLIVIVSPIASLWKADIHKRCASATVWSVNDQLGGSRLNMLQISFFRYGCVVWGEHISVQVMGSINHFIGYCMLCYHGKLQLKRDGKDVFLWDIYQ